MNEAGNVKGLFRWYEHAFQFIHLDKCASLKELINSTRKFDLLIFEPFHMSSINAIGNYFHVPVIYMFPNVLFPWMAANIGTPANPSYLPTLVSGFGHNMVFVERVQNTLWYVTYMLFHSLWLHPLCDVVAKKIYSGSAPLMVLDRNVSLIMTNTHFSLYPNIPLAPNVVQIGGVNVQQVLPLPEVSANVNFGRLI